MLSFLKANEQTKYPAGVLLIYLWPSNFLEENKCKFSTVNVFTTTEIHLKHVKRNLHLSMLFL